ncbi:alpha/beta fold hydrolase [Streptomyces sp. NPDC002755]
MNTAAPSHSSDPSSEPLAGPIRKPPSKETRQLIATAENYIPTHRAYHQVSWPGSVPVTIIVSEQTPFTQSPEDARDAAAFVKAGPDRTLITADGSSHDVPVDRPKLVLDEIKKMAATRR